MTTNPEHGMQAIGELENGRYRGLLERVAKILEMKLEREPDVSVVSVKNIRIWRNHDSTSPFADFGPLTPDLAYAFFVGLAVGIQGDWTP